MAQRSSREKVAKHLPLPQSSLNILLALAEEGHCHGYAIKRSVEKRTAGEIRLGAGTLYEALQRLHRKDLIFESQEQPEDEMASSRWRCYGISELGRQVLEAELKRLEDIVRYARTRRILAQKKRS